MDEFQTTTPPVPRWERDLGPIPIGISSCLLGQAVRFDGGHKRSAFLTDEMGAVVRFVPVCPELEAGLGVPRPAIRLEEHAGEVRVRESRSGVDHTDRLKLASRVGGDRLEREQLCGYVFKKDSPSCGLFRVKVVEESGQSARRDGRGVFAELVTTRFPDLPVEEEGRLNDSRLREAFIERIFAYRRQQILFEPGWTLAELVRFHSDHKLQLMSHCPARSKRLGRIVAGAGRMERELLRKEYRALFLEILALPATRGRHVNAMQHMLGYLREHLEEDSRHEVLGLITDYEQGHVPITVPLALLRHHVRAREISYLDDQHYFDPHPKQLRVRQHLHA